MVTALLEAWDGVAFALFSGGVEGCWCFCRLVFLFFAVDVHEGPASDNTVILS